MVLRTEPEWLVIVRMSDQQSSVTARVTLRVNNVDEAPTATSDELAVSEGVVVTDTFQPIIGAIIAVDPDTRGQ